MKSGEAKYQAPSTKSIEAVANEAPHSPSGSQSQSKSSAVSFKNCWGKVDVFENRIASSDTQRFIY